MIDLAQMQVLTAAVVLAALWTLESTLALVPDRRGRLGHAARNISIGAFNAAVLAVLFAPLLVQTTAWVESANFGLLNLFELPVVISVLLALLLQDALMYAWHRANHSVPFLWRFHRVHHSDTKMDASTAVRFHTGEILISAVLRLGVVVVLGLELWQILLYDLLLVPVILFHHSNVRFPEKWDRIYRLVLASPAMHRVHHSPERLETDSNYGSIFSFWDRLARSYRLAGERTGIRFGLDEFSPRETERLLALAAMPFRPSGAGRNKKTGVLPAADKLSECS